MVGIAIFSGEAMWKSNSRWATEDLIWKSDILSRENLKIFKAGFQYQKMTGETPEVRSNKRKPRMLLRHRTS